MPSSFCFETKDKLVHFSHFAVMKSEINNCLDVATVYLPLKYFTLPPQMFYKVEMTPIVQQPVSRWRFVCARWSKHLYFIHPHTDGAATHVTQVTMGTMQYTN